MIYKPAEGGRGDAPAGNARAVRRRGARTATPPGRHRRAARARWAGEEEEEEEAEEEEAPVAAGR
jgi:hypothetical protein